VRRALCPAFLSALLGCATVAPQREGPARAPPASPRGPQAWSESDLPETNAPPPRGLDEELAAYDFQARLAVRARSYLGRRGPFRSQGQRFASDCSGYVEAIYAAEGVLLRDLMARVAPEEPGGVKAAWYAARAHGRVFGPPEWPAPGDLVFWNDTYDRNRNGRADDRFTHLGIVEYVQDGTVYFLHRGGRGVARGVMTPDRPYETTDADGRALNSPLRAITHPVQDGSGLAGALLAGYGRIDPARVPAEYATRHIDPFYGPGSDREAAGAVVAIPQAVPRPSAADAAPDLAAVHGEHMASPEAPARSRRAPAAASARTEARGAAAAPAKRGATAKPSKKIAAKKAVPAKKTGPHKKAAGKKALARAKTAPAPGGDPAGAGTAPPQRAETADAGGTSAPSSPTRTAEAPKSSSDSRRSTGTTEPVGSR
jgi:probable lipoprotein NlpC